MQRIDAGYLYELGDTVRCLRPFRYRDEIPTFEIWGPLHKARQKANEFLTQSVYSQSLRAAHQPALQFQATIDVLLTRIAAEQLNTIKAADFRPVSDAFDRFEPVLASELSTTATFLVQPKGAYDVTILVEAGERMFPFSLAMKVPEAIFDAQQGSKALAFELWTAAAFHFHRANESVLRRYFDQQGGKDERPKTVTMGTMLAKLKVLGKGHSNIIVALENIKEFHRNPIIHPGSNIENADSCLDLVAAIRAAMGYMLEVLPLDFSPLTHSGGQFSALPIPFTPLGDDEQSPIN